MMQRVLTRAKATKNSRADDTIETFQKRISLHQSESEPVIDTYRREGVLVELDAEREEEQIVEEFLAKADLSVRLMPARASDQPKIFSQ